MQLSAKKNNCTKVYIGETKQMLKSCLKQHCGYVQNNIEATGQHFNLPGHSLANLMVTVFFDKLESQTNFIEEKEKNTILEYLTLYTMESIEKYNT